MSLRTVLVAGVYASLVPLVGTLGWWGLPLAAAPFVDVEAPAARGTTAAASAGATQTVSAAKLPVQSTRLERRTAPGGLSPLVQSITHADPGPAWLAWTVPSVPGQRRGLNRHGRAQAADTGCVLDDEGRLEGGASSEDDTTALVILTRFTAGRIDRVAFTDARCTVQAGNRTVYWIDAVQPADSVGLLAGVVRDAAQRLDASRLEKAQSGFLAAIALTDDPSADKALESFVAADALKNVRRDAAFWLGAARGAAGARVIDRLVSTDRDDEFRQHLTFVLTLTGDAGVDRLIDLARHDPASDVRRQALFWLSQKAGERAVGTLAQAVDEDPDAEVRKQAVFAISQLPKDEGVPRLIALAETHRDREVRKQAMFWLGQSGDPRALALFEEVLKK